MKSGNTKPIENVFLDTNLFQRMLKAGIRQSLRRLEENLASVRPRTIRSDVTRTIISPMNVLELAGYRTSELVTAEALSELCTRAVKGIKDELTARLFNGLNECVDACVSLDNDELKRRLLQRCEGFPKDSKQFVQDHVIGPVTSGAKSVDSIKQHLVFQLLCSAPIAGEAAVTVQTLAIQRVLESHLNGGITSAGKFIPKIWQLMKDDERLGLPLAQRNAISKAIGMHAASDFVDSDLIHLGVCGLVRNAAEPVYCFTEDDGAKLRHRALIYKSVIKTLANGFRRLDRKSGKNEFRGLDFKHGYIFSVSADLRIEETIAVQTLKKVGL